MPLPLRNKNEGKIHEAAAAAARAEKEKEALALKIRAEAVAGRAEVEYASAHDPVRLFSVAGFDDCVVRFTTDVPYLSNWGKPLLLGPGSILDAHTDHERIAKHELERAVDLYVALAKKL